MCADTPDYKDTLFLPQTGFPMRAGLPAREPDWLARWERIGVYDRRRERAEGRAPFVLHDGPPYANGHLHIGHGLNKILKDFVVRSQQMMGRDARYVPGWDCHGLPIEWKIEEALRARGKSKDDVPVAELRAECRRFAEHWVAVQRDEFKRMGVTGNWDDPYLTMDFGAEAVIAEEFMKFVMNGSLYLGSKPVMWSPVEKTALAEAEVEYHDHQSHTVWVKFPIKSDRQALYVVGQRYEGITPRQSPLGDLEGASVVIWTTTPWTIPQNKAIAYDWSKTALRYALFTVLDAPERHPHLSGQRIILGYPQGERPEERFEQQTRVRLQWERDIDRKEIREVGIVCAHPFQGLRSGGGQWDYDVPLLPADFVTEEIGTGFVHMAPSHGADDYELFVRNGLAHLMTYNVLEDGTFRSDLPFFGGLAIFDARGKEGPANKAVIDKLAEVGALVARGRVTHSYPHSWRSKAPLIFRNTPQWFAAIDRPLDDGMDTHGDTIRARALTSIDELVTWTPPSGRNRLHAMVEARPDWVLSRQRAWGVPLTCFVKKGAKPDDPDFLLRDPSVNARIAQGFRSEGSDAWFREDAKARFLASDHDPEDWEKITDILDVWFDSGSTHAFVLRDRADGAAEGIADLYLEGTDQHRGWFQSSMLQACGTMGRAPYRGVLTHGFTLDAKGLKMSKSLGNATAPAEVIRQYGADILRLWVAQADYTADLRIGPEILKGTADSYRRLRNTLRFLLGSLHGFAEAERVEASAMPELERWVLHRLAELDGVVRAGYAAYDFQHVFQSLFQFCTLDLSALYFDIRKDALYCDAADSLRRRAARTVLDALFHRLTTWLAPMLAFTMEEVWLERFPGDESSVHLQDFPETPGAWRDAALAAKWETIRAARRVVTGALEVERRDKRIGASLEAAPVAHVADAELRAALASIDFAEICITSDLVLSDAPAPADGFALDDVAGVTVAPRLAQGAKCARCWKVLPDVGTHAHAGVCARCDAALG